MVELYCIFVNFGLINANLSIYPKKKSKKEQSKTSAHFLDTSSN